MDNDGHDRLDPGAPTAAEGEAPDEESFEEALDPGDGGGHTALPPRVESWRRRSATGAILTGLALGFQQALEAPRDEPTIVMETSGDPPRDLPVEADFEYGRPRQSVVSIRPWLITPAPGEDPADAEETP